MTEQGSRYEYIAKFEKALRRTTTPGRTIESMIWCRIFIISSAIYFPFCVKVEMVRGGRSKSQQTISQWSVVIRHRTFCYCSYSLIVPDGSGNGSPCSLGPHSALHGFVMTKERLVVVVDLAIKPPNNSGAFKWSWSAAWPMPFCQQRHGLPQHRCLISRFTVLDLTGSKRQALFAAVIFEWELWAGALCSNAF